MQIKARDWGIFILLSVLCLGFWYKLEYPRFSFLDLSFNKQKAFLKAEAYLRQNGVDPSQYSKAIIFDSDVWFNRYLQHTIGIKAQNDFIAAHDYDLFFWQVRFFKELQKNEYSVRVSAHSGNVVNYAHLIEETEPMPDYGKDLSKQKAEMFLRDNFGLDLEKYEFHEEKIKRYEKRTEYSFSWEKKGVYVPWRNQKGGAKLLATVTVSGAEITGFNKNFLELPEKFTRFIQNQFTLGECFYSLYFVLSLILLMFSVYIVLKRRQDLTCLFAKRWFCFLAVFFAVINIIDIINNFPSIVMSYYTSARLSMFISLFVIKALLNIIFLAIGFVMPGIAGECLCNEIFPRNKYSAFLHYIKSSFFNRSMAKAILFGYILWVIMLGLQAVIFFIGTNFFGVWRESYNMAQFSSSYVPLLSAFIISFCAGFNEEIIFRLFGISFLKKYLRNSILAVLISSLIWGLGHSMYAIFPVWFRVIEVSLLGLFYGFIFLRFGLIPLIVAHYLFDAFWTSAEHLLGRSSPYLFFSSIGVLCIPIGIALIAYFLNKSQQEKQIQPLLNDTQGYNLQVLITYISAKKSQGYVEETIKKELITHNWDYLLVNLAIDEVFKK